MTNGTPHRDFPNEQTWYDFWSAEEFSAHSSTEIALYAGAVADRLSWVFVSGYQAALKHVFGDIEPFGWVALAASEDRENAEIRPGTKINEKNGTKLLSGFKSWVAQSRYVDHLLVTVKEGKAENRTMSAFLISSKSKGVELSHRDAPSFLGEMSQGFAKFDEVDVTTARAYSKKEIKRFTQNEPPFVMLAATAFMINHADNLKNDLLKMGKDLVSYIEASLDASDTLVDLDTAFQDLVRQFEENTNCDEIPNWSQDRQLLSMYSHGIQKLKKQR